MSKSGNSNAPSRKGWTPATLERLGVEHDHGRYVFTVYDHAGEVAGRVRYADDGSQPKMRADAGMSRDLWPRPEDVDGGYLVVVEGEPDAVTMAQLGLPVVALPGTGKWQTDWPARLAAGRDAVFFVADCDVVGRKRMEARGAPGGRHHHGVRDRHSAGPRRRLRRGRRLLGPWAGPNAALP
jgi:hypothetical protein